MRGRPEISRYCLPSGPENLIEVERALIGRSPFQTSLPVEISKARIAGSSFPAMNASAPAVMRSVAVERSGKHLPADIVVKALNLLDGDAFDRLVAG
jgi:hypothetical protein